MLFKQKYDMAQCCWEWLWDIMYIVQKLNGHIVVYVNKNITLS